MTDKQCKLCSHRWTSRTAKPVQCPRCKRYGYETKVSSADKVRLSASRDRGQAEPDKNTQSADKIQPAQDSDRKRENQEAEGGDW